MCLGIPGQIVELSLSDPAMAIAEVSGVRREVNITCVAPVDKPLQSLIGSWVLIHVGFAMSQIDEAEAARTLTLLHELNELDEELDAFGSAPTGVTA
jgi:hydrogenase expression/formation protein HypC